MRAAETCSILWYIERIFQIVNGLASLADAASASRAPGPREGELTAALAARSDQGRAERARITRANPTSATRLPCDTTMPARVRPSGRDTDGRTRLAVEQVLSRLRDWCVFLGRLVALGVHGGRFLKLGRQANPQSARPTSAHGSMGQATSASVEEPAAVVEHFTARVFDCRDVQPVTRIRYNLYSTRWWPNAVRGFSGASQRARSTPGAHHDQRIRSRSGPCSSSREKTPVQNAAQALVHADLQPLGEDAAIVARGAVTVFPGRWTDIRFGWPHMRMTMTFSPLAASVKMRLQ